MSSPAPVDLPVVPPVPASAAADGGAARGLVPGLVVTLAGTAAAAAVNRAVPLVSPLVAAVVLGVLAGPLVPAAARPGTRWATRRLLRAGVVLLGLQLSLADVVGLGPATVAAAAVTVAVGFTGTLLLGRLLGVPRGLRLLVATGFSVCGASAVAAMESVADADDEEVATAVTLVTLYGTVAIAAVPLAGHALHLSAEQVGAWAGISIHEVGQVVAAASPAGAAALAVAVAVKLTRVVLLAPLVAVVGAVRRRGAGSRAGTGPAGRRPPVVPLFVLGFLALVAARSTGLVPDGALATAKGITSALLAAALFALGTGVRPAALVRAGRRALLLGALSTLLVATTGLLVLHVAGR